MPLAPAERRHRHEVSRLEGFSDAVFGFAITLLVVSLEVPKTFEELLHMMRGLPAFAVSFALLFQIWWRHYKFFRSYDLEDGTVIALTGFLLFVVLFYVYPLKFLWSLAFGQLQGTDVSGSASEGDAARLMEIYSAGVAAVFATLALLHGHAYRLRRALGLTPEDIVDARVQTLRNANIALLGMLSIGLAVAGLARTAGFIYFGIGLSEWALGSYQARALKKLA
jgi:hypothetical protein